MIIYEDSDTESDLKFVKGLSVTSRGSSDFVSREEWVDYYSGVYATNDNDAYVDLMIRSAFGM